MYQYVIENYPHLSKKALNQVKTITIDQLRSRPYIFTSFLHAFDEDVYLLKMRDIDDKVYDLYMIKYETMEEVYKNGELINHKLVKKIRFENEQWYRNFFFNDELYEKNRY